MSNAPVLLAKSRDFGRIVSDTFLFLKQNFVGLYKPIALICLGPALLAGYLLGDKSYDMQMMARQAQDGSDPMVFLQSFTTGLVPMLGAYVLLGVVFITLIALVYEYMRAHHLGEHGVLTTGDLFNRATGQLGSYFVAGLLYGLASMLGFVLCVLPGIYLMVALGFCFMVHAIERTGGTGALGRSMAVVKDHWWETFGLVLVMGLIGGIISGVVMVPSMIVGAFVGVMSAEEALRSGGTAGFPEWFRVFMVISNTLQVALNILTYPISAVALGMKYFALREEKEHLGLREQVSRFDAV